VALLSTFLLSNIDLLLFSQSISNPALTLTLKHNNVFGLTKWYFSSKCADYDRKDLIY